MWCFLNQSLPWLLHFVDPSILSPGPDALSPIVKSGVYYADVGDSKAGAVPTCSPGDGSFGKLQLTAVCS